MATPILRKTPAIVLLASMLALAARAPKPAPQSSDRQTSSVSNANSSVQGVSQKELRGATISDKELAQNVEQKKTEDARKRQGELLQEATAAIAETRNAVDAAREERYERCSCSVGTVHRKTGYYPHARAVA